MASVQLSVFPSLNIAPASIFPARRKFTRTEFARMTEMGIFEGQRLELVEGEILVMAPMGKPHAVIITVICQVLLKVFPEGYNVRPQVSFILADETEIYPDIAVVRGEARDYLTEHPRTAVLIVEVADSSLEYDRRIKSELYARAGVQEYWIVNLMARQLEVYHDPVVVEQPPFAGYRSLRVYAETEEIALLEKPDARLSVADLLP